MLQHSPGGSMKITNVNELPDVLVRAISSNWYSGSGEHRFASVTQLMKPTKIVVLEKRHWHEITQDASELIWSLMGSAMHKVLEAGEDANSISEERVSALVDEAKISGGVDFYEDGVITDFKFTGVWNYLNGSRKEEWEKQLNMYAYLYREQGFEVNELRVLAIFRDWQKRRSDSEPNYPRQVETISIPLWDQEQVKSFISERVQDIRASMELPDDMIPECSCKERWQAETQYAVYKQGGTRAMRVFPTKDEADTYVASHKDAAQLSIVIRQELPKRCMDYCPVNSFCHYYQTLMQNETRKAS